MEKGGEELRRAPAGPQQKKKADVRVISLPGERLGEAASLLACGFRDDPNFVNLFPGERARSRALPRMFAAVLRDAWGFGHVYAAMRGVEGATIDELAAAPRSARRLLGYTAGIARLHPAQPYWCLEVVGVDPRARGLGIGTRLPGPVLALADETGQTCYLETMTARNVGWCQSLDSEVREAEVRFVAGGPPNWTMMRPPVRDRGAVVPDWEGMAR